MKIISFYNAKGGTGKTSLCYLSGLYLAEKGNKVLFVDLDSQCSLTGAITENRENNIFQVLSSQIKITESIQKTENPNIDILPGTIQILKIQNSVLHNSLEKQFNQLNYDFVLLDCPPSYHNLIVSAIYTSDLLVIPSLLSLFDVESVIFTLNEARDIKANLNTSIVLNRINKNTKEVDEYMEMLQDTDANINTFRNDISVRRVIDRKDSLELKRNLKLLTQLEDFINSTLLKQSEASE